MGIELPARAAVVPVGAPGAGKTTLLDGLAAVLDEPGFRFGPDDVRLLAFGTTAYQGAGHLVYAAARDVFAARLASRRRAAFDAMNTRRRDRRVLVEVARRFGGVPVALLLPVAEDELLRRNDDRPPERRVPPDVVVRHARRVAGLTTALLEDEGFSVVHVLGSRSG